MKIKTEDYLELDDYINALGDCNIKIMEHAHFKEKELITFYSGRASFISNLICEKWECMCVENQDVAGEEE